MKIQIERLRELIETRRQTRALIKKVRGEKRDSVVMTLRQMFAGIDHEIRDILAEERAYREQTGSWAQARQIRWCAE